MHSPWFDSEGFEVPRASSVVSYESSNIANSYVDGYNSHPEISITETSNGHGHGYISMDAMEGSYTAKYDNSAFGYAAAGSAVLLADDVTGFGVADDLLIPVLYVGASVSWIQANKVPLSQSLDRGIDYVADSFDSKGFKYVTYTKTNKDGLVYVGRTSGFGTAEQIVRNRDRNHHMNQKGFFEARLTFSMDATFKGGYDWRHRDPAYWSIRGAEQLQIEYYRSQGNSANARNGIWENNKDILKYMDWGRRLLGF